MSITVGSILFMIVLFAGIFYLTHREPYETNTLTGSNETKAVAESNGTAESLGGKIRRVLPPLPTEFAVQNLPKVPREGLESLRAWRNGSGPTDKKFESNGTGPAIPGDESAPESEDESEKTPLTNGQALTSKVSDALNGWNIFSQNENHLPPKFREWVAIAPLQKRVKRVSVSVKAMKNWLTSLDAAESEIFTEQVAAFTSNLNFELGWLVDQELEDQPDLKKTLEEAVSLYCLANFKALLVQDELRTFISFKAWQESPTHEEYLELTQRIFSKLVEKGVAQAAPSELLLASEEEREEHAVLQIRNVLKENREIFNAVFKEVIAEDYSQEPDETSPAEPMAPAAA